MRLHRLDADRAQREHVYFIQAGDGPVKIGYSTDVHSRIMDLQVTCPSELTLHVTMPGGKTLEHIFHTAFADLRVRGEWYAEDDPNAVLDAARRFRNTYRQRDLPSAVRELDDRYAQLETLYRNGSTYPEMSQLTGLTPTRIRRLVERMRYLGFDMPWRSIAASPTGHVYTGKKTYFG